jgi:hypothetical protein
VQHDPWGQEGPSNALTYFPGWASRVRYALSLGFSAVGASYIDYIVERDSAVYEATGSASGAATGVLISSDWRWIDGTDDQFFRLSLQTDATGGLTVGGNWLVEWKP